LGWEHYKKAVIGQLASFERLLEGRLKRQKTVAVVGSEVRERKNCSVKKLEMTSEVK